MTAQITTFLAVPDAGQGRAAFVAAANAFGHGLTPLSNEINAVALEIDGSATAVATAATSTATARDQAHTYMQAAQSAALAEVGTWTALAPYNVNDLVWGDATSGKLYRAIVSHSGSSTPPADDGLNWVAALPSAADVNALAAAVTAVQTTADGLLDVPSVPKSAAYTLALTDRGKSVDTSAAVTIPTDAVAFPIGAVVMVTNVSEAGISLTPAAGVTLRLGGFGNTGARTLDKWGVCSLRKVAPGVWVVTGTGLR